MEPLKFELFLYANRNGHNLRLMEHLSSENKKSVIDMERNIYVISASPVDDHIFAMGDSEGTIVIVDVTTL